jgi:hypothetical protein
MSSNVGRSIDDAIKRAQQHEATAQRKLRVRLHFYKGDDFTGLWISAVYAARNNIELVAQGDQCWRRVPWAELDQRASELCSLVDEVVREATKAIGGQITQ